MATILYHFSKTRRNVSEMLEAAAVMGRGVDEVYLVVEDVVSGGNDKEPIQDSEVILLNQARRALKNLAAAHSATVCRTLPDALKEISCDLLGG